MSRKKTPEQYLRECREKGYDLPIEDYKGNRVKIRHKCSKGHVYSQVPYSHLQGIGCSICKGTPKKTTEEYVQECKEKGYDLPVEKYKGANKKIKHKCKQGHIYEQTPHTHLSGKGCYLCLGNAKKTPEEYVQECKEKGYDPPIEDYVNNRVKIKHRCKQGHIYEQSPHTHLSGKGCYLCLGNAKKTSEYYVKECTEKGTVIPIECYVNAKTKIKHRCNKCGNIWKIKPNDILHGYGCPVCKESHGERFIRNYLDNQGINYTPQKKFNGLKDKDYLSYDFYLPDYNILIEYQGKQHYRAYDYFGGESKFKKQQYHDNLKRKYAKENGYKLLELHYSLDTQDKVNRYLKRRIK